MEKVKLGHSIITEQNPFLLFLNFRHWLYGDKVIASSDQDTNGFRVRGWFPRICAIDVMSSEFGCMSKKNSDNLINGDDNKKNK